MSQVSEHQPEPKEGNQVVVDVVLADIRERAEAGREKYGTYLKTDNGRDALMDAYQEAIDLVMYLCQAILERDAAQCPVCFGDKYSLFNDGLMHPCPACKGTGRRE